MKRRIRLSESDLHRVVKESLRRMLKETSEEEAELAQSLRDNGVSTSQYFADADSDEDYYPEEHDFLSGEELQAYREENRRRQEEREMWKPYQENLTNAQQSLENVYQYLKNAKDYVMDNNLDDSQILDLIGAMNVFAQKWRTIRYGYADVD